MSTKENSATVSPVASGQNAASRDTVTFMFEGRTMRARVGDSVAVALVRNGVEILSHSVKYGRPRGLFCARGRCVTCLLEINREPGIKSCITPVAEGMNVRRQDFRPPYGVLLTEMIRRLPFPAGFYFRFFTRPRFLRKMFLGSLREMAGVGRINIAVTGSPQKASNKFKENYDIIVIGAGLSGMTAAMAAADAGAEVLLVDEYAHLGGHSLGSHYRDGRAELREQLAAAVTRSDRIDVHTQTTAQGLYETGTVLMVSKTEARRVKANATILATGEHDVIPLFGNNDLLGIYGLRAIQLLLERDGIRPGTAAVVYGQGSDFDDAIALLEKHAVRIVSRARTDDGDGTISNASVRVVRGRTRIDRVDIVSDGHTESIACDMLVVATPGQPAFELPHQAGYTFAFSGEYRNDIDIMRPVAVGTPVQATRVYLAGRVAGTEDRELRRREAGAVGAVATRGEQ